MQCIVTLAIYRYLSKSFYRKKITFLYYIQIIICGFCSVWIKKEEYSDHTTIFHKLSDSNSSDSYPKLRSRKSLSHNSSKNRIPLQSHNPSLSCIPLQSHNPSQYERLKPVNLIVRTDPNSQTNSIQYGCNVCSSVYTSFR